ncbi:hypothetical protein JJL56_29445 [Azospirillum sp. YIM DDC1]|uniref:Uncharacterized protein n=1 Tax=Azospirillum aestuarii TaxID=2802052 RepID=A0ABS1I7F0_9PROT|nr:hypothetical protein [Azospirillum aestuarii]MBK4722988.1 hypothetical protein [Azospirillum aestuarii]
MFGNMWRGVPAAVAGLLILLAGFGTADAAKALLARYLGSVQPDDLAAGANRFGARECPE